MEYGYSGLLVPLRVSEMLATAMLNLLQFLDDAVKSITEAGLCLVRERFVVPKSELRYSKTTGLIGLDAKLRKC